MWATLIVRHYIFVFISKLAAMRISHKVYRKITTFTVAAEIELQHTLKMLT